MPRYKVFKTEIYDADDINDLMFQVNESMPCEDVDWTYEEIK